MPLTYSKLPQLDALLNVQLCELLVDPEEGFQEWTYRHVRMVQRTIGTKKVTGGSEGVKYLITTLSEPFFQNL